MAETGEKKEQINERLSLISRKEGLTFGTDAYLLSAYVKPFPNGRAVDLGAGTGVISLLCASRNSFSHIACVEIQEEYCSIIARNAAENGLDGRISVLCGDVKTITKDAVGYEADAVFSNPPYMRFNDGFASDTQNKDIARREVLADIHDFCACAARLLKYGGLFTVVYRPDRLSELLCAMTAQKLEPKRLTMVYPTANHVPCLVLVEAKKGANPGMFITKPLILEENGRPTADIAAIYDKGAFHEPYRNP